MSSRRNFIQSTQTFWKINIFYIYLYKINIMGFNKKEWMKEYRKRYINTPNGRASNLVSAYNKADRENGRGRGDLTAQWIVDNIFSKPCAHCGKEGWKIIGCNRLDNTRPHTMDNVEPCCRSCNNKIFSNSEEGVEARTKGALKRKKEVLQIDNITGEIINKFDSVKEAHTATHIWNIASCCRGERNEASGFVWRFN